MKHAGFIAIIIGILVTVLLLGLVAVQFLPFWSTEKDEASISEYVWWVKEHKGLTKYFKEYMRENFDAKYSTNSAALMPVTVMICAAICVVLCVLKPGKWPLPLIAAIGGGAAAWGYLREPIFRLGANWQLHMVLGIVTAVVGVVGFGFSVLASVKKRKSANKPLAS